MKNTTICKTPRVYLGHMICRDGLGVQIFHEGRLLLGVSPASSNKEVHHIIEEHCEEMDKASKLRVRMESAKPSFAV